jgi:hypothetical protein
MRHRVGHGQSSQGHTVGAIASGEGEHAGAHAHPEALESARSPAALSFDNVLKSFHNSLAMPHAARVASCKAISDSQKK